jgi:soluble lytic murein transglycosylase-like protein
VKRGIPILIRPFFSFVASFGLTLVILESVFGDQPLPGSIPLESPPEDSIEGPHAEAAEAIRQKDFGAAEELLAPFAQGDTLDALETRVLLGLYAHTARESETSLELLRSTGIYQGELADWRLFALADSATSLGRAPQAKAALDRLIQEYPSSPLRAKAMLLAAEQAFERGDYAGVAELAAASRDRSLDLAAREELAVLAWDAGEIVEDPRIRRQAARQLLVEHPLVAADLEAVEEFRNPDGSVNWAFILESTELEERARNLLTADLPGSALETLGEISEDERGFEWTLIRAAALVAERNGEEALVILDEVEPQTRLEEVRAEWQRAEAAIEVSIPRRQRRNRTASERQAMHHRSHEHLRHVAAINADPILTKRALSILFHDLIEEDRFDEALLLLQDLQKLDPEDTTGSRQLWRLGWREFSERNYSSAIGYWTELTVLYPRTNYNRSGLYWSARAHDNLGNHDRAQQLYRQVVDVEFTDFYRRHALRRLGMSDSATDLVPTAPTEPWPSDPLLERAERLHRWGLTEAALLELNVLEDRADSRATEALRALILAASGERRQSIIALRKAFPVLGTPYQNLAPIEARRMYYPLDYRPMIQAHAKKRRLPSHLVFGMIRQESAFDARARSWAGARGLMQVMPATGRELARRLGLPYSRDRLSDPEFSIELGTEYFSQVLEMFDGDQELALAGYNAGPYRIKRLWKRTGNTSELDHFLEKLHWEETKTYVKRVLLYSDSYRRLYGEAG